jgi:replication initiation and membrane attachment protein DnaB
MALINSIENVKYNRLKAAFKKKCKRKNIKVFKLKFV